jgi:hypothetical protein
MDVDVIACAQDTASIAACPHAAAACSMHLLRTLQVVVAELECQHALLQALQEGPEAR